MTCWRRAVASTRELLPPQEKRGAPSSSPSRGVAPAGRSSFNPTAGCRWCAGSPRPWLPAADQQLQQVRQRPGPQVPSFGRRAVATGAQGAGPVAFSSHARGAWVPRRTAARIEGLSRPAQGAEGDGVCCLGLLQLAHPGSRDLQSGSQPAGGRGGRGWLAASCSTASTCKSRSSLVFMVDGSDRSRLRFLRTTDHSCRRIALGVIGCFWLGGCPLAFRAAQRLR